MVTLLVVDDEPKICGFLKDFFSRRGHAVIFATNPLTVPAVIEAQKPNIILLDILMPEMSGIELLKQIKETNSDIKVIMVTAVGDQRTRWEAMQAGADAYIEKPFATDYLETVVMTKIEDLLGFTSEGGSNG